MINSGLKKERGRLRIISGEKKNGYKSPNRSIDGDLAQHFIQQYFFGLVFQAYRPDTVAAERILHLVPGRF